MATSMRLKYLMNTSRLARLSVTAANQQCRHVHFTKTQQLHKACGVGSNSLGKWSGWHPRQMMMRNKRMLSTESAAEETKEDEDYHSIIKDTEKGKGESDKKEFQAETRKLLDIVAKSLYSEKEVFIRELISNASDALEKLRYLQLSSPPLVGATIQPEKALEIHIATDDAKKTFTIQDTGVGMTKDELVENLGIIARSGTKSFLDKLSEGAGADKTMIGQFGVGFYSSFMVGEKVDVYTRSHNANSPAYKWSSDGQGEYEISEAENVDRGSKIVIHLKGDCYDFAKEEKIREVIQKYSNFVGVPIFLNGKRVNVVQALWMMETREITEEMHEDFYRFISGGFDRPRFRLHYKADAPINIRALFYVPEYKPTLFDMSRETDVSVTLYSRKVMILAKANHVLPRWLRFVKGVVDSEDIPLNLSRELLQDSNLIRKLRWALTNRLLKFFQEQAKKDPAKYQEFYEDYGLFFREGIVTSPEQKEREEISKLLRFESSKLDPGQKTSLVEYGTRMKAGDRNIYFFSAPSRHLAETSPYMEAMKAKNIEVLFCYEPYDELVLMNLAQFENKHLKSVENELTEDSSTTSEVESRDGIDSLTQEQANDLMAWMQVTLGNKIQKAKITNRLDSHPCILSITEMGAARHFLRTTMADKSDEERFRILQPTLEINPRHPIIMKLHQLKDSDGELAKLVTDQIYDNAMIAAGLMDDPRSILNRMNELLSKALAKH